MRDWGLDRVELLYLHAPDPKTPIEESAGELLALMQEGKTRTVGVSNVSLTQLEAFAAVCPIAAFQPAYNMLQRQIERDALPWCERHGVSTAVYWPLMKGLLAGRLSARSPIRSQGWQAKISDVSRGRMAEEPGFRG